MDKKLFYNPIWMPSEEMIFLWCCEVPEQVQIKSLDAFQYHIERHYKQLSKVAFEEHGEDIYKWYHNLIDDNYWYRDHETLIDCFLLSDKYGYQRNFLEERIARNEMPEDIIGSDEAQAIFESVNLYDLFYMYYESYAY